VTDRVVLDPEGLTDLARAMATTQRAMARSLLDLEHRLTPLGEEWTGDAASAYADARARWRRSMVGMVGVLAAATRLVQHADEVRERTEQGVAGQWPG
jgi:WXG100 family type VII secretion target